MLWKKGYNRTQKEMTDPILRHDEPTKTVHICAWCDNKGLLTKAYREMGYFTSHGACKFHFEKVMEETIQFYEKNGFKIANDDLHADSSASMQYDTKFII